MTDIVERLLNPDMKRPEAVVYRDMIVAANEIERLRGDLFISEVKCEQLATAQLENKLLREALEEVDKQCIQNRAFDCGMKPENWWVSMVQQALQTKPDDSALREFEQRAKLEGFNEGIDVAAQIVGETSLPDCYSQPVIDDLVDTLNALKREVK